MINNYLDKFNKDGFVVIKNILNKREIDDYLKELKKLSEILIKDYVDLVFVCFESTDPLGQGV